MVEHELELLNNQNRTYKNCFFNFFVFFCCWLFLFLPNLRWHYAKEKSPTMGYLWTNLTTEPSPAKEYIPIMNLHCIRWRSRNARWHYQYAQNHVQIHNYRVEMAQSNTNLFARQHPRSWLLGFRLSIQPLIKWHFFYYNANYDETIKH